MVNRSVSKYIHDVLHSTQHLSHIARANGSRVL